MMKSGITIGEKYGPAMAITEQAAADAYFEECVQHCMSFGRSRPEAEAVERSNLGYYAGYYDHATRERVERLFGCAHPIFGKASDGAPAPEEALAAGSGLVPEVAVSDSEKWGMQGWRAVLRRGRDEVAVSDSEKKWGMQERCGAGRAGDAQLQIATQGLGECRETSRRVGGEMTKFVDGENEWEIVGYRAPAKGEWCLVVAKAIQAETAWGAATHILRPISGPCAAQERRERPRRWRAERRQSISARRAGVERRKPG